MNDLARDTFIEKINPVLRWILVPIFSLGGAMLFRVIYGIFINIIYDPENLMTWVMKIGNEGLSTYLSVFLAALTAPRHQFVVGAVTAIIVGIFGGVYLLTYGVDAVMVASTIGVAVAVIHLHEKLSSNIKN